MYGFVDTLPSYVRKIRLMLNVSLCRGYDYGRFYNIRRKGTVSMPLCLADCQKSCEQHLQQPGVPDDSRCSEEDHLMATADQEWLLRQNCSPGYRDDGVDTFFFFAMPSV